MISNYIINTPKSKFYKEGISILVMAEIKIEVKGYRCERCGHEWIPRKKGYPVLCPNCKSAYWDKPARKKK